MKNTPHKLKHRYLKPVPMMVALMVRVTVSCSRALCGGRDGVVAGAN